MANQVYPLVMTAPPRHDESGSFSFPADTALPGWLGSLPASWRPYAMLARLDRPVGIWLLYLPCVIGLAFQRLSSGLFLTDLAWAALFFIGAAILTPPDVVTQVMMALPLMLLYEISIVGARIFGRKPLDATDSEEATAEDRPPSE